MNDAVTVVNNRTLTVSISTDPTNAPTKGSVVLGADNKSFVYTPTVQGPATDTFVYIATDGASSKQATVTVNIGSANDVPVITIPAAQMTNEDSDKTLAAGAISVADPDAGNGPVAGHGECS